MPLTAFCLHCRQAVDLKQLPIVFCPKCGHPFPPDFARELEARFVPERPLLLTIQMVLGYALGAISVLTIPGAFKQADLAVLQQIGLTIPPIPAVPLGILTVVQTVLLLWSSWAIQKNQPRSRPLLMWLVGSLVPQLLLMLPWALEPGIARALFSVLAAGIAVTLALAWWYLYRNKSFTAYYATLEHLGK